MSESAQTRSKPADLAVLVEDLAFRYRGASEPALDGVNLRIDAGEICLLVGATAAGKSTLYMALSGLVPHVVAGTMTGSVRVCGQDTVTTSLPNLAQKVGLIFQDPTLQLFSLSVEDELAFGPENLGLSPAEIHERVRGSASIMGLEELLSREPSRLSGGQQQSVAIGATWSMAPDILVMDEPTSNLDPDGTARILGLLRELNQRWGKTILIAEHKIDDVAPFVDRVVVLHQGRVLLDGGPREVLGAIDTLHPLGIQPPTGVQLAHQLRESGIDLPGAPFTLDETVEVVRSLLAER